MEISRCVKRKSAHACRLCKRFLADIAPGAHAHIPKHPQFPLDRRSVATGGARGRRRRNMAGFRCYRNVGIILLAGLIAGTAADARARNLRRPSPRALRGESPSSVLLLALQDGPAGERILKEWTDFAESASFTLPPIYVICSENSPHTAMVRDLPHVEPFVVTEGTSWATVLSVFRDQASCVLR